MQRYGNLDGDAGIAEYELAPGRIFIRFVGKPAIYEYDQTHPGTRHVRKMKERAKEGRGLTTYVNRHVRADYAHIYESEADLRAVLGKGRSGQGIGARLVRSPRV